MKQDWYENPESAEYAEQMKEAQEMEKVYAQISKDIEAWQKKWPNHCKNCGGWGSFYYRGSRMEPPSADPCEAKPYGLDHCHRCGGELEGLEYEDDSIVPKCKVCGWQYDDGVPSL